MNAKCLERAECRQVISDSEIIDALSDPKFRFGYSIKANGTCQMTEPRFAVFLNLRQAVRFAITTAREQGNR